MFRSGGIICSIVSIWLRVLFEISIKFATVERCSLGNNRPRMDNDGMESGNAQRRSARNKSNSFQYRVRLAEGITHIRIHEGSCFLLETLTVLAGKIWVFLPILWYGIGLTILDASHDGMVWVFVGCFSGIPLYKFHAAVSATFYI